MLLQREVPVGEEDRVVEILTPAHDRSWVALHIGYSTLRHDQGSKEGILVHNDSATATESFYQLHACLPALLLMHQLIWLPVVSHSIRRSLTICPSYTTAKVY